MNSMSRWIVRGVTSSYRARVRALGNGSRRPAKSITRTRPRGGRVDTRIGAPFSVQFRRAELCLTRRCQCGHPSIEPSRLLIITVGVRHLRSLPVEKPKKRFHPFRPSLGAHPLVNAECGMGKEKWRMADGRWRMVDGGWQMADGGW